MGKHLTLEDRIKIQSMLCEKKEISDISIALAKHPSTIKREIVKHRIEFEGFPFGGIHNRCVNRQTCSKIMVCSRKKDCYRKSNFTPPLGLDHNNHLFLHLVILLSFCAANICCPIRETFRTSIKVYCIAP